MLLYIIQQWKSKPHVWSHLKLPLHEGHSRKSPTHVPSSSLLLLFFSDKPISNLGITGILWYTWNKNILFVVYFFFFQLQATCNVDHSLFNDWFSGHLNFQIEHQWVCSLLDRRDMGQSSAWWMYLVMADMQKGGRGVEVGEETNIKYSPNYVGIV